MEIRVWVQAPWRVSAEVRAVADLEGNRAGSAPPPFGDGLTPSLRTVLLICDIGTVLWRHHRNFYILKQRSPAPVTGLRGPTSKENCLRQ